MKAKLVFFTVMLFFIGASQVLNGQMTGSPKTMKPYLFEDSSDGNPILEPNQDVGKMGFFKRMCNKTKFSMYQDVVIDYDMLTGKQNLFLRKVGSSDRTEEVKYSTLRTVLKIKKNRTIYLRIRNYNSNLYRVMNESKNNEFNFESDSRKRFIASFNALNPEQSSVSVEEPRSNPEEKTTQQKDNSRLTSSINNAFNKVEPEATRIAIIEELKVSSKEQINYSNASEKEKTESVIIIINRIIEESHQKFGSYTKTMNTLTSKHNQNLEKLEITSKVLHENLQEVALRKDPKKQREDVVLYLNEYMGRTGVSQPMPTLNEFKKIPLTLIKDMKEFIKNYSLYLDTIKTLNETVTSKVVAINTMLTLMKNQADSTKNQVQQLAEQYKVILNNEKEYINNLNVRLLQMKQIEARVNSKDWDLYFTEIYKTGEGIQNAENEIELKIHQANKDIAKVDIQFEQLEKKNGTLGYEKLNDTRYKIEHDFMVYRGTKLSFSTGVAFSFPVSKNAYSYTKKYNGLDTIKGGIQADSIIVRDAANSFSPVWMNMIHAQWRSSRDIAVALSMGIGITLNETKQVQYLLGTSLIFGSSERFVLSGGVSAFRTNKLGGGYSEQEKIPNNLPIPVARDQYTLGVFIATSFNFGISN